MTRDDMQLDELARRANVPIEFVERLVALGGLRDDPSSAVGRELGRTRLLYAWSQAGFPPETIMRLVDQKALSITFLDTPGVQAPGRLDRTYEDIAEERAVPGSLLEGLHESMGFETPSPQDRAGEDDLALLDVVELFRAKACPGALEDGLVAGAEVELSMLFADVRGSSQPARQMPVLEFTRLMNRFYRASSEVLFEADAIIEKFVGDEVVGLFLPFLAGRDHARKAVDAAEALLLATGHGSPDGPWIPLGAGVHTGSAFVGIVSSGEDKSDFTALGDAVNIAAHLASQATTGEVLGTDPAAAAASLSAEGHERRHLSLKGHEVDAVVVEARRR